MTKPYMRALPTPPGHSYSDLVSPSLSLSLLHARPPGCMPATSSVHPPPSLARTPTRPLPSSVYIDARLTGLPLHLPAPDYVVAHRPRPAAPHQAALRCRRLSAGHRRRRCFSLLVTPPHPRAPLPAHSRHPCHPCTSQPVRHRLPSARTPQPRASQPVHHLQPVPLLCFPVCHLVC
jgi:hypothetical protein